MLTAPDADIPPGILATACCHAPEMGRGGLGPRCASPPSTGRFMVSPGCARARHRILHLLPGDRPSSSRWPFHGQWQGEPKRRARAFRTFHPNVPLMVLDDGLANMQPPDPSQYLSRSALQCLARDESAPKGAPAEPRAIQAPDLVPRPAPAVPRCVLLPPPDDLPGSI
jgi:hypothetical protein